MGAQPDTIVPEPGAPQSLNRYSYTLNNPVKYTDPSGHNACLECVGAGAGGAVGASVAASAITSQAGQALNLAVADAQVFLHSLSQQLGNLIPAIADQFANPGQASSGASGDGGNLPNPGGPDPDKLNRIRAEVDRSTQRLQEKLGNLKAHLTQLDLEAARQEAGGQPLQHWVERGGSPTGHLQEVMASQRGLTYLIGDIQKQLSYVVDGVSPLSVEQRLELERLLSEASKLLDKSEGYVAR